MKTSAISNPVNLTSGTASTTKLSDASSDAPFSQMLSREMAARPTPSEPAAKSAPTQGSKEPKAAQSGAKAEDTQSAAQSEASDAPESASGVATAEKSTDKPAAKEAAKATDSDTDQDDETTVSAASADLLALVASLTQSAGQTSPDDGKQTALNATDDGAKSHGKSRDTKQMTGQDQSALPAAQGTAQDQNVPFAAQTIAQDGNLPPATTAADQNVPLAAQPTVSADNIPVAVQLTSQIRSDARTTPAPPTDKAPKLSVANAARRAIGAGTDTYARAAAANTDTTPEPKEFDAALAQAKDDKAAPSTHLDGEKSAPSLPDLALKQSAERPIAKAAQDIQPPAAAPFNLGALAAAQAQPTPQMIAQAADLLAPRVGKDGWDQALGQKVVWMVGSEQQSASLTLNPPDLGPLQVVLHISENQATANFTAAQPEVRHALEAAMPKLREMLGDAGIQLSQANVSAGTPNNQQGTFGQPQQSSRQAAATEDGGDAPAVRVVRSQTITGGQGLVDTFA